MYFMPAAGNSVAIQLNYKHFDVLSPKYDIFTFGELKRSQRFRYKNQWRIKVGPEIAQVKEGREMGFSYTYLRIPRDHFTLILKEEEVYSG